MKPAEELRWPPKSVLQTALTLLLEEIAEMQRGRWMALISCVAVLALTSAACGRSSAAHSPEADSAERSAPTAQPTRSGQASFAAVPSDASLPGAAQEIFGNALVPEKHGSFGLDRTQIMTSNDPRFPRILRVFYPAGSASQRSSNLYHTPGGGAQLYLLLRAGSADLLYFRFYVRFPSGFDFVKGGKLPGLFGGTVTSGRHIPNGSDGFSTRYMWRKGGAAEVYAYLPSSVAHGTSFGRGSWVWKPGVWTCVEQKVRLNTPGASDGTITVWVDGIEAYRASGLEFRTTGDLKIDGVFFSTFFGGGDFTWASPRDQYADFAGFAVSYHAIGQLPGT